jgi:hypothetical protein
MALGAFDREHAFLQVRRAATYVVEKAAAPDLVSRWEVLSSIWAEEGIVH